MKNAVLYIHGKGGSAKEADFYKPLFCDCEIIGFDYLTNTPWDTGKEIAKQITMLKERYEKIILIANSIGAYYSMNGDIDGKIERAFFISPIVNMEKLISNMMKWANVSEERLKKERIIKTDFGEDLSWDYLCYVRSHTLRWNALTHILYGSKDNLTEQSVVEDFVHSHNATLEIMQGGEHWFHTKKQMDFLANWILQKNGTGN